MQFTKNDIVILREILKDLPFIEWHILYLRYWENLTILEISEALQMKWEEVNEIIENLLIELKEHCLNDPDFGRSESMMHQQYQQSEEIYYEAT